MARPYRSRAPLQARALAAVLSAAVGAAIVLALGWEVLGPYRDLIFVDTALRGLLIGLVLAWVCQRVRFSRPRIASAVAIAATLGAIFGGHYNDYLHERERVREEAEELQLISIGAGRSFEEVEEAVSEQVRAFDLQAYIALVFGDGQNARDGASRMFGARFGRVVYLLEVLLALGVAIYFPSGRASEPACSRCGEWAQERTLGHAAYGHTPAFLESLSAGRLEEALARLEPPDTRETLELGLATCPRGHDAERGVLRVREHFFDRHSRALLSRHREDLQLETREQRALIAQMESIG